MAFWIPPILLVERIDVRYRVREEQLHQRRGPDGSRGVGTVWRHESRDGFSSFRQRWRDIVECDKTTAGGCEGAVDTHRCKAEEEAEE